MKNFIAIILDPTRVWSDHGVIDLDRGILVCKTTCSREADRVAEALNEQAKAERIARGPIGLITAGGGE